MTVSWTAPTDDGGSVIDPYILQVYVGDSESVYDTYVVTGGATEKVAVGLTNGIGYRFDVQAKNATGLGPVSVKSDVITPVGTPGAPTSVSGLAGPGAAEVTVSWTAPVGGSPVTAYEVEKSPSTGGPVWSAAGSVTGSGTSVVVPDLAKGSSWVFRVRAVSTGGAGAWSDPSAAVIVPATVPGAPVGPLVGTPGVNQVVLSWSAPVSDGGSPITGYQVWLRVGEGDPWSLVTWDTGSSAPGYTVAGLVAGTGYQFAVRANNAVGESAGFISSDPGIVPLPGVATVPGAPVGPLVGTPGVNQVVLSWSAPVSDGGSPIPGTRCGCGLVRVIRGRW